MGDIVLRGDRDGFCQTAKGWVHSRATFCLPWVGGTGEKEKFCRNIRLYKTPSETILSLPLVELNQLNKSRSDYKIKPKCLHRRDIFIASIK